MVRRIEPSKAQALEAFDALVAARMTEGVDRLNDIRLLDEQTPAQSMFEMKEDGEKCTQLVPDVFCKPNKIPAVIRVGVCVSFS